MIQADAASHDFQPYYLRGSEVFEVHPQAAQGIAVRHYQYVFTLAQDGHNFLVVIFHGPRLGLLQAFAVGRGHIVAPPPFVYLRLAVFQGHFSFVEALQITIHPLPQCLGAMHRNGCLS